MRNTQKAILLAVSVLVVVSLVLAATMLPKATTKDKTALSVDSFVAENLTDYLQLSLSVKDQNNNSVAVNGTGTLTILDNKSATLYQSSITMTERDFQSVSTPHGTKLLRVWQVNYSDMKASSARAGVMTCNLNMDSAVWKLVAASNSVSIPATLSAFKLYFVEAMPGDQESMMADSVIQAGVIYEPYASDEVIRGIGKVMLRSSDIWPDHPSYVIIMDKTWAANHPDLAARVIKAHMDAELWIQSALASPGSDDYNYLISKGMQISNKSEATVIEALKHIKFNFELTDKAREYLKQYSDGYIEEGLYSIQDLQNRGYIDSSAFARSYIDTTYLSLAQSITPTDSQVGTVSIGFVKGNLFMLPSAVALDRGTFEKYGLTVSLPAPNGYNTSALNAQALIRGNVSVAYVAICPAILDHIQYGMQSVMVAQMAAEGTALVVKNNVFGFDDLAGKTIASPGEVTIQGIFMMVFAERYGFTLQPKP